MTWIGPRVTMTMGEDIPMLRVFSRRSKRGVPAVAIIFQLLVSNLLLLTQSFEAVLDFIQFSLTFCSFFAVLGVIKMRITHPHLPRPYRAWGYPVTPVIFLGVTALHDVLSRRQPAASIACRLRHNAGRTGPLLRIPPVILQRFPLGCFPNGDLNNVFDPAENDGGCARGGLALCSCGSRAERRGDA